MEHATNYTEPVMEKIRVGSGQVADGSDSHPVKMELHSASDPEQLNNGKRPTSAWGHPFGSTGSTLGVFSSQQPF